MSELFDEEKVYDEQILPLMAQIIEVCREHNIPMVATFNYANDEEGGVALCTSSLSPGAKEARHCRVIAVAAGLIQRGLGDHERLRIDGGVMTMVTVAGGKS